MAYIVRNSNNSIVATIADNTVDTSTSIQLIGKNYVGYGTALNQNIVRMLENFAKTTSPTNPIAGQIWFDTSTNDLKVYDGSSFVLATKTVANLSGGNLSASGTITATGNISGNQVLSVVADGTPPLVVNSGSRIANLNAAVSGNLINGTSNVIVNSSSYVTISVGGTSNVVNVATTGITVTGNANISVDTNVTGNISVTGNSSVTGTLGIGTASPSYQLETTSSAKIGTYLGIGGNPSTTARIALTQGADYTLGTNYAAYISGSGYSGGIALDATSMQIGQNSGSRALTFHSGASWAKRMTIDGSSGNVGIANTSPAHTLSVTGTMNISGAANIGSTLGVTGNITSGNLSTSTVVATGVVYTQGANGAFVTRRRDNNADAYYLYSALGELRFYDAAGAADRVILSASGNLYPNANASQQLGLTTNRWSNVWGVSSSALYADLAEKYRSDADYEPGTVLEIGGEHEITVCNTPRSDRVFGCVSTEPAYLMNDTEKEGIWLPVVLTGRAPIRVSGTVSKGDRLVSAGNGAAMAAGIYGSSYQNEIGRALEDKDSEDIGLIEAYISTK